MTNFGIKKFLLVAVATLCLVTSANAQTCSKARVKDLTKQLSKAERTLAKNERSLEQKTDRWATRRNNYEESANSLEDQKLQYLTDITTAEGVLTGLESLLNSALCALGLSSPEECRTAVKNHRQGLARLNNFRRRLLSIEQKLTAVRNRRDSEGAIIEAELGRIANRITTGQTQIVGLQFDLAACQSVAITVPSNNANVSSPFNLRMTPVAIRMQPKGITEVGAGYLVIIADGAPVVAGGPVPAGAIELVNGETRTQVSLPAGPHTVVVQVFNGDGSAYTPQVFKQISVTVTP